MSKPLFQAPIISAVNDCLGLGEKQEESARRNEVNFDGYHILLAEDIEINREIVETMLEPTLLKIDCAVNGLEAVRLFCEAPEKYDFIFMDLHMPGMDGHEATRRIRAFEADYSGKKSKASLKHPKGIPIVAMTANVFNEAVDECLKSGMNGHTGKPLNFVEIIEILKSYLLQKK
jgi:CheY-like chemotaxis protein